MSEKPKTSLVRRNALLIAVAGWLMASFATAQLRVPIPTFTSRASPPNIIGGFPTTVLVTLSAPWPSATTIALTSSLPAVASVPPTVAVPAGSSSFSYTVSTSPVGTDTSVQISARVVTITGGVAVPGRATLSVLAPVLMSLALDRSSVPGGVAMVLSSTLGTTWPPAMVTVMSGGVVSISGPAPSGLSIALASSDPAATVPSSVVIPANGTTAHFPITTTTVATPRIAQISAQLGTVMKSAPLEILLTVIGASVSPTSVDAGQSLTGSVALSGPAPSGGAVVTLAVHESINPDSCHPSQISGYPLQLTVPAGSTSATFPISTHGTAFLTDSFALSGLRDSTLIASYGGSARSNTFKVVPPASNPAVEVPAQIKGGTTAAGKIKLDRPPLSNTCGTYVFWLGTNGAAAQVPFTVIFPVGASVGASEAGFSITTTPVESNQPIALSVTGTFVTTASVFSSIPVNIPINIVQPQPVTFVVTP